MQPEFKKIAFKPFTVGWLVYKQSLESPIRKRRRITLCGGMMNEYGRFNEAIFIYNGEALRLTTSGAIKTLTQELRMENMEVWLNEKELKKRRIDEFVKWACNPDSETYWCS